MKTKLLILAAAALAVGETVSAQTIVNITGATAFRTATLNTIKARFNASGQPWKLVHDQNAANNQSFNGATLSIFEGTFPGVSGTTIIRTSFNGSVEGINALVNSPAADPNYLQTNVLTSVTAAVGGNSENGAGNGKGGVNSPVEAAQSHIAFSDVAKAASPFKNNNLQPTANSECGVVVFTMVGSESLPATVTNLNTQNFRALLQRDQPMSFLSGDPADANKRVYATGRNDGSGTRTTYMAETMAGITTKVNQYLVGGTSGDNITKIYRIPAGGSNTVLASNVTGLSAANASTVWGQDVDGNGGYSSGSTLRSDLARTSTNVLVYDADGSVLENGIDIALVSFLSASDATTARTGGAKILGYNGVRLDEYATNGAITNVSDLRKITNGLYTAWSYQQMYRRNDITSGDRVTVYNGIKTNLVLGGSGLLISQMNAGREIDGGVVAP